MTTNGLECGATSYFGELHTMIRDVIEISLRGQSSHHSCHGGRCNFECVSDIAGGRVALSRLKFVNGLEVVFDGRGERRGR